MELKCVQHFGEAISDSKAVVGPIPLSSDRKNLSMPFSNVKLEIEEFINSLDGKILIARKYNRANQKYVR